MRVSLVVAAISSISAPLLAQDVRLARSDHVLTQAMHILPVHAAGRVSAEPLPGPVPTGAKQYLHQWPAVYFETAFSGDRLVLKFDDPHNEYRLTIDQGAAQTIAQPGAAEYLVTGLPGGLHHVRLEKVTESIDHASSFEGFYVPSSEPPHRVEPRARQIEFIGDSGMTGYGIRSDTRSCTQDEVRLRSDTQIAYPALVAKQFDADYQVNAISGRGLIRNYGGQWDGDTMLHAYRYAVRGRTLLYDYGGWRPQVIFIMLGSNDFFGDVKAGERWSSLAALAKEWTIEFEHFVASLQRHAPKAKIIIAWPDRGAQANTDAARAFRETQRSVEAAAQRLGKSGPIFIEMTPGLKMQDSACDYHPSAEDHRQMAAYVAGVIETATRWRSNSNSSRF
jgi:lysophospholipase L1-like esterase